MRSQTSPACADRAHGINIKLAKSGGIREAVRMVHAARALGLGVMLGCMVESGLGIAPGAHIASLMDHVDLDGNLLLAHDPWPGRRVRRRRAASVRRRRGLALRPRRLLILAEGRSNDPHYGKTARGVLRYRPQDVVAVLDSESSATEHEGFPLVHSVAEALHVRADRPHSSASQRRAADSRPRGATLLKDCIRAGLDVENGLHEFIIDDRSSSRSPASTASSCAICACRRRAERPDRREPDARGDDDPHGRLRLRDREDDGVTRARPRSADAAAGEASSCRPDRRGSRSPAGGSPSTRSSPTSSPAQPSNSCSKASSAGARCSSSRARARCCTRRTRA